MAADPLDAAEALLARVDSDAPIFAVVQDEIYAVERQVTEILDGLLAEARRALAAKEPPPDAVLEALEALRGAGLRNPRSAASAARVADLARRYADERRAASAAVARANEATAASRASSALRAVDRALDRRDLGAASRALSPLLRSPEVQAALATARREALAAEAASAAEGAEAGGRPAGSPDSSVPPAPLGAGARMVLTARSRVVDRLIGALLDASGLDARAFEEPPRAASSSGGASGSEGGAAPTASDGEPAAVAAQRSPPSPGEVMGLLEQASAVGPALDALRGAALAELLPPLRRRDAAGPALERGALELLKRLREGAFAGRTELAASFGCLLWPRYASEYVATRLPLPERATAFGTWERTADRGARLERRAAALDFVPGRAAPGGAGPPAAGPIERSGSALAARFLRGWHDAFVGRVREALAAVDARDAVEVDLDELVGRPSGETGGAESGGSSSRGAGPGGSRPASGEAARVDQRGAGPGGSRPGAGKAAGVAEAREPGGWDDAWEADDEGWDSEVPQPLASGAADGLPESRTLLVSRGVHSLVLTVKELTREACDSGSASLAREACDCVADAAAMTSELQWWLPGEARPPPEVPDEAGAAALPSRATRPPPEAPPYAAALWRNDCALVHDVLRALPGSLSPVLQELVHRNVEFVNPAARVARSGAVALGAVEASARAEIAGALDDLCAFSGLDDGRGLLRCRRAVQQCLVALRRIRASVGPVLPAHAYVTTVGELAQFAGSRAVVEVMSLGDIAVEECEAIPTIARDLADGVLEAAAQGLDPAFLRAVEREAPALSKLRAIADVLEMRLLDIRKRWASGSLAAAGLQARELAHLVRAVFQPSPLRSGVLDDLER